MTSILLVVGWVVAALCTFVLLVWVDGGEPSYTDGVMFPAALVAWPVLLLIIFGGWISKALPRRRR